MKLLDICDLKSGFQGKTTEGNQFKQIKLKDVTKGGIIKYDELEQFDCAKVNEKYILKKGDIILKAKSGDITAIYKNRTVIDGVSNKVNISEIAENNFNLTIQRYVEVKVEKEELDME